MLITTVFYNSYIKFIVPHLEFSAAQKQEYILKAEYFISPQWIYIAHCSFIWWNCVKIIINQNTDIFYSTVYRPFKT